MIRSQILVRGTTNANWKVGDVIMVKPVGFQWGRSECEPNFKILESNVYPDRGVQYVGSWDEERIDSDGLLVRHIKAKAKWCYVEAKDVLYNKETGEERKLNEL